MARAQVTIICILLAFLTSCRPKQQGPEVDDKIQECGIDEQEAGKISIGMSFDEVKNRIVHACGEELEDAYPLPWNDSETGEVGYHAYFHLADGTCVQVKIRAGDHPEVVGFAIASKGQGYEGKLHWFDSEEVGHHGHPDEIDLGQYLL